MSKGKYQTNESDLVWRKTGDKIVILFIQTGEYVALNETASFVWEELQNGSQTPQQISKKMVEKFDVSEEKSLEDVEDLFKEWRRSKLISQVQ